MTFFTPTYNRRSTLSRVYESLVAMRLPQGIDNKPVEFEWLIIDDGSSDDTKSLVAAWCQENLIPIRYFHQPNQGKHIATNSAVDVAIGEMFTIIDSDDRLYDNALTVFYNEWQSIPVDERTKIKGVTGRCLDPATGKLCGTPLPRQPYRESSQDMRLRDHVKGEMIGFNRLDIMKEFSFPVMEEKTSFCPESIVWFEMGKKYKESVVDIPLREYFNDTSNALTNGGSSRRAIANYYLWQWEVNNLFNKYWRYSPKDMFKAVVGVTMDGFRTGRSLKTILNGIDKAGNKIIVALFSPAGYILSKRQ
ncbi:MAG: glycosyltransferase family 2 protein [Clostridiales bacterium]|nr:glycosyltransferase family 2 protein [Clostridiales bacterium]